MKKIKLKRSLSLALSGFMSVSLLGGANLKLNAEEGPAQMVRFATKNELVKSENFNLSEVNETTHVYGGKGTKAQRVYFGKAENGQPQKWYIAGSEHDNNNNHDYLVLFSDPAQPLSSYTRFGMDNKYSSSNLKTSLEALTSETSTRFTSAERNIMAETTYLTALYGGGSERLTSKLYPANGNDGDNKITVGSDDSIEIKLNALTSNNFEMRNDFWLRAPSPNSNDGALVAWPGDSVGHNFVDHAAPCGVSASKIDLTSSSLIFASSAPAASSSKLFTDGNVMTFRYQDTAEKIKSNAEINGDKITITKEATEDIDVYLYVQGKDGDDCWFYSQAVTKDEEVSAAQIGHNANLSQCNVWLEYKDAADNMVYAKVIQTQKSLLSETEKVNITKATEFTEGATLYIDDDEVGTTDGVAKVIQNNVKVTVQLDEETRKTHMVENIQYLKEDSRDYWHWYNVGETFTEVNENGTYTVENFTLGADDISINVELKPYYTLTIDPLENAKLIVKVNGAEMEGNSKYVFGGETIETTVEVDEGKTDEYYASTIYYEIDTGATPIKTFNIVSHAGKYQADDFTMPTKDVTIKADIQRKFDMAGGISQIEDTLGEIQTQLETLVTSGTATQTAIASLNAALKEVKDILGDGTDDAAIAQIMSKLNAIQTNLESEDGEGGTSAGDEDIAQIKGTLATIQTKLGTLATQTSINEINNKLDDLQSKLGDGEGKKAIADIRSALEEIKGSLDGVAETEGIKDIKDEINALKATLNIATEKEGNTQMQEWLAEIKSKFETAAKRRAEKRAEREAEKEKREAEREAEKEKREAERKAEKEKREAERKTENETIAQIKDALEEIKRRFEDTEQKGAEKTAEIKDALEEIKRKFEDTEQKGAEKTAENETIAQIEDALEEVKSTLATGGNNGTKIDKIGEKTDKIGEKIKEIEKKLAEKESSSGEPTQKEADKPEQIIDPNFAIFSGSSSGSGSGGGFVTSSINPVTISQPMASKLLKESVEFGNKVTNTDSGSTILVDVSKIENSALTQEQKDMFKDKDVICLDFTSNGNYDQVETINYKLSKDLANREFKVYYIYDGKIQLLTENFKLDNEGNIKITSSYGASYILVSK